MAYENSAGLGVFNHFGPRVSGGESGVLLTDGYKDQFVVNLPVSGLPYSIPKAATGRVKVSAVDLSLVTGTVTHIAVGGVDVYDSVTPVTLPVALPADNTGVVVVTGGTGGDVVLETKSLAE